jgi:hypothetical protein
MREAFFVVEVKSFRSVENFPVEKTAFGYRY